jgi:starch synthase (maltosyl-transferring)
MAVIGIISSGKFMTNCELARCPWRRVVIEAVHPQIDGGRFPIKRVVGEEIRVEADIFADGHDDLAAVLLHCPAQRPWSSIPMRHLGDDRWEATFTPSEPGRYLYTVEAWVDSFLTWVHDLRKRLEAGQDVQVELLIGAGLIRAAAGRAPTEEASILRSYAEALTAPDGAEKALAADLEALMGRYPERFLATRYERELAVMVDRERARFSAWYELFPRSTSAEPGRHGTFRDVERWLPYITDMGFDVLYLTPIHPIGRAFRKGRNNVIQAGPGDVGSPWAIGGPEGGHKAVHPELGTLDDFRHLVAAARELELEVAIDIAFQASPDHPYVREHPEWFRARPDGSIQYAENPPKKYQDIYPFDFECETWPALWYELKSVFEFWIEQGVSTFRVDNPHTKPFAFWEWLISQLKQEHPELILLSEAFTRPKVMHYLAKLGFSQSYTYFAWRNRSQELREYFTELNRPPVREFFRPNLWPNTPDILTEALQRGGLAASAVRLVLAATLGASYGIFGPSFELGANTPLIPGKEEYLDSEKYQLRTWNLDRPRSLRDLIRRINRIRRQHPALQQDHTLRFLETDNERLLAYAKTAPQGRDSVVTIVNLDPEWKQAGWVELPVRQQGYVPVYHVEDLLNSATYTWTAGERNYVELDPSRTPAHVLLVDRPLQPGSQG